MSTDEEIAAALEFLQTLVESTTADQLNHWQQLSHAMLASSEFVFLP